MVQSKKLNLTPETTNFQSPKAENKTKIEEKISDSKSILTESCGLKLKKHKKDDFARTK